MSNLNEVMKKIEEVYLHNLECHKQIYEVEKEIPSNTDSSKTEELKLKREGIFKKLIEQFTSNQDFGIKGLDTDNKVEVFKWILTHTESIITTGVIRNIVLLVCSGSGTDDFSGDSNIWFSSISQYTDCKIKLAKEITKFCTDLAMYYWYLQCSLGLEINLYNCINPDKYITFPELYATILSSLSLEFISVILIKADYKELSKVLSEGFRFIVGARARMEPIIGLAKVSYNIEDMISKLTAK